MPDLLSDHSGFFFLCSIFKCIFMLCILLHGPFLHSSSSFFANVVVKRPVVAQIDRLCPCRSFLRSALGLGDENIAIAKYIRSISRKKLY